MKVIKQTDTYIKIRHLPVINWVAAFAAAGFSIYGIIQAHPELPWVVVWFLMLLGSLYIFFFGLKVIDCFVDKTRKILYIRKRNLIKIKTHKHFLSEVSNVEICEEHGADHWEYYAFINLKSGERIYLGTETKQNLEKVLHPLAKLIDCPLEFVPKEKSFWDIFYGRRER